jgi:hypothetical protein
MPSTRFSETPLTLSGGIGDTAIEVAESSLRNGEEGFTVSVNA